MSSDEASPAHTVYPQGDEQQDRATAAIWNGLASTYDAVRPAPPAVLLDLLTQLAKVSRPCLVVDLGSGTGLSTRAWVGRADEVIGVEPNPDMRRIAAEHALKSTAPPTRLRYVDGTSTATGLPGGQADIVTIAQALHWMDPEPTFAEVARLLRPGGIFAAYDYDWPPVVVPETEAAFATLAERAHLLAGRHPTGTLLEPGVRRWDKEGHMERIRASGRFRLVREVGLASVLRGGAEAFIGLTLSDRVGRAIQRQAATEEAAGIAAFRQEVRAALGDEVYPWYLSYRVRLGVRPHDVSGHDVGGDESGDEKTNG